MEHVEKLAEEVASPRRIPITYFAHKTTAVRNDGVGARGVLAARNIAAEGRGAARLDRAHHLQLRVAHVAVVGITPCGPEIAEDIRDFQSGMLHDCAGLLRRVRGSHTWPELMRAAEER